MTFDPTRHRTHPLRSFDDFEIGEVHRAPSRTMTEAVFAAFQTVSGDNHPIHYDREYLRRQGHRDLMAHGLQTASQVAIGAMPLAHQMGENLIAFVEQSSRFLAPVYCGDTLYPAIEITAKDRGRTTGTITLAVTVYNQSGDLVLDGHHKVLMRL